MAELGKHAVFILSSYGVYTVVLVGLATWLVLDGRRQKRLLQDLEARGIRRRSARGK
jgi:heme exporter protein D